MKKTNKWIWAAGLALAAACAADAGAAGPVKIALLAPLSGPQAALGQDKLDAFKLALE